MSRSLRLGAAAVLAAAAFTSGCGVGPATKPPPVAPVEQSPFTLPSPDAVRPRAPLTGLETEEATKAKRAVIVPIEIGTGAAAPVGLDKADVVELEFAEGKLLRVAAVYQSTPADKVGPVAAVRPAEIKLLNQLQPYMVHNGTPKGWLDLLTLSKLAAVTPAKKTGFTTVSGRVYVNTGTLQATAPAQQKLLASLFQFGQPAEPVATGSTPATTIVVAAAGHTAVTWKFDATTRRWQTTLGGVPVAAANLILLTTPFNKKDVKALDREVLMADPVGKGAAQVFGAGQGAKATWAKEGFFSALNLLGPEQSVVRLSPGPSWILLLPSTAKVTVS
ncbi:hypothetical protein Cme02nite_27480 [Catellatospora methionotrophica]|uniref:DUF3048 domain-containing protein n=1 Tax=Catellatospora methionotrophica TaxID=121620 RepID=A0A8J3PEB7_9ACTN|nr:DUF3048 domain-containing protein [Catellatospora methionotrophica]GIG14416.1 hypothetical protein Cme02nite_27480 [Catellatospora methionotrophica]